MERIGAKYQCDVYPKDSYSPASSAAPLLSIRGVMISKELDTPYAVVFIEDKYRLCSSSLSCP